MCSLVRETRSSSHFDSDCLIASLQCDHSKNFTARKNLMNTSKFSKSSALMAIGMVCASIAMLTHNSNAAASHAAPPAQRALAPIVNEVTELPPVLVVGKRLHPAAKLNFLPQRKLAPVTLV
jgi:hypothetical protein